MTDTDVIHARDLRPRHLRRRRKRAFTKTLLTVAATGIVAVGAASLTGLAAQAAPTTTATAAATATAGNVIANGRFNSGLDGWTAGSKTTAPVSPTSAPTPPPAPNTPAGWKLVWNDEFNGTSIDKTKWNVDNRSTYGDGNHELACLMDRAENVKTAGGLLTITARKEATPIQCGTKDSRFPNGRSYTSAMLSTKSKVDFEYGRFEVRAKTPLTQGASKGLWPAFWMRPTTGGIGELDILEAVGTGKADPFTANRLVHTIHYDYIGTHPPEVQNYTLPTGTTADGFHSYAVEWAPGSITWYVDGRRSFERNLSTTSWLDQAFGKNFYLRLNLAVGGNWPGSPDADTAFPATYQVDYVRVYQR
ncbi:MAG: glycoside hydrolase family 16 protein [Leifsonia sp.]